MIRSFILNFEAIWQHILNILRYSVYLCSCICVNMGFYVMDVHMDIRWEATGEDEETQWW